MARFYYLGPWIPPDPKDSPPAWRGPTGTLGAIDLRGSGGGAGLGFFTTAEEITEPGYEAFGSAKGERLDSLTMSAEQRAAWASTLGVPESPDGSTLLDLLWDELTIHSDPDGVTGPKPIMPTSSGSVDLHLGGHSLVRSARVPRDPTALPHWDKVQRVLQSGFREVADVAARGETQKQRDLHKRWLGFQQEKYRLTAAAATALIVPEDMPRTSPMKPETTITDDFNRADSDPPSNAAAGWAWTEVSGTQWRISTNRLQLNNQSVSIRSLRAETDLSGDDHYAQAYKETNAYDDGQHFEGPAARFSSSAETFYLGAWREHPAGTTVARLYSVAAGSLTQLGSDVALTGNDNTTMKVECDGSTIRVYHEGSLKIELTDTSIASGTRVGVAAYYQFGIFLDDFEAADLSSSTPISVSDTAAGSEAPTVAVAVPVADTGAGTEAPTVAAAVPAADTGSGSDAPSIAAAAPVADVGAGSDAPAVTASVSVADVGAGVEAIGVLVSVDVGDAGSGSEVSVPEVGGVPGDTGSGVDSLVLAAAVPVADSGLGIDGVSVPEGGVAVLVRPFRAVRVAVGVLGATRVAPRIQASRIPT